MTPLCVNPEGSVQVISIRAALNAMPTIPGTRPRTRRIKTDADRDYDADYYARMSQDPEWMAQKAKAKRDRRAEIKRDEPELEYLIRKRDNARRLALKYQGKIDVITGKKRGKPCRN